MKDDTKNDENNKKNQGSVSQTINLLASTSHKPPKKLVSEVRKYPNEEPVEIKLVEED